MPTLRPVPVTRPLAGLSSAVQPRRLNVVHRPKSMGGTGLRRPAKKGGFFANLGNLVSIPGTVIKGLPTFIGKTAQTIGGIGEGAYDFALDLAAEIAGADREYFTSRFETDLQKARELGLKGSDLIAYASQRQYPLGGELVSSGVRTAGNLAELATLGRADFGEPGFNYLEAYRRGELPQQFLLEDVGNLMLAGRAAGLGSVAGRAGAAATRAGAPRLGTAVRRTGYLSEQPIAATLRGTARLAERAIPQATARGGRLARIAEQVAASERPIRTLAESTVANRRAVNLARLPQIDQQLSDVNQEVSRLRLAGEQIPERLAAEQSRLKGLRKRTLERTAQPKLIRQEERRLAREQENTRNLFVQRQGRFVEKGPVPESPSRLRRIAESARRQAERTEDPVQAEALRRVADESEKFAAAKEADTDNRMTNKEFINESGVASVLINTGLVEPVLRDLRLGRITFDQAVDLLLSDDNNALIAEQGYAPTANAVRRALTYVSGNADLVDQVGIEAAGRITQAFSDYMETQRATGEGMVRGAASPFEAGNYPLPEYVANQLNLTGTKTRTFFKTYVGNIIEYALSIYEQRIPDIRQRLGVENVTPDGLFDALRKARKDSDGYTLVYQALSQAYDDFGANGRPDPAFFPEGTVLTSGLAMAVRMFLRDPMIFPAKLRPMMALEQRLLRSSRGRDVETFALGLQKFVEDYPDLVTDAQRQRIADLIQQAMGETSKFDVATWRKLRSELNRLDAILARSLGRLEEKIGARDARRQNALVRINEIRETLRIAQAYVEDLVNNPDQFVPTETAEVARLRSVAREAGVELEAIGPVTERPTVDTYEQRVKLNTENQRLAREQNDNNIRINEATVEARLLERRRRETRDVTPDQQAAIEDELARSYEVTDRYSTETEASVEEARQAKATEISGLEQSIRSIQDRFPQGSPRFRRSDLRRGTRKGGPEMGQRDVSEDLNASIEAGTRDNVAARKEFIRRFTESKETESTSSWDEFVDEYARINGIDDINMALEDAARTFTQMFELEQRLKEVRRTNVETYRKMLSEQQANQLASDLDRAYAEAGVRSPEELIQILNDIDNPAEVANQVADLLQEIDDLRNKNRELSDKYARNEAEIARLVAREEASVPRAQAAEVRRLRGVEQEATQAAEALLSENLATQQAEVKGRLRGVGKVVEGKPRLQRQFEGPALEEQQRLQTQQERDARVVEEKRAEFAAQERAQAQARQITGEATAVQEQMATPVGPALLGEERTIQYIPAGPSRVAQEISTVARRPGTEGMAPEAIGSFERMRTGAVVALTPSQVMARISEVLNGLGRNIVVQNILKNRNFVSTVADMVPQEVRDRLMGEATAMNPARGDVDTATLQNRIQRDYEILLFRELDRMGLEVITPVEFPDPADPFAPREAVRALKEPVAAGDITDTSLVMTKGLRETIGAEFEQAQSRRIPQAVQNVFNQVQRMTGNWKAVILPFSIRWQIGDLVGNVINSWVRGDIPPAELAAYMSKAYELLRENQLTPEGQPTTLRSIMFGQELGGRRNDEMAGKIGDPLLQLLQSYGLQSSGANMADTVAMLEGTNSRMIDALEGRKYRKTRLGQGFGRFQEAAFSFNEFQNRLVRQAVALRNLDQQLQKMGRTLDDVTYETVRTSPELEGAIVDAVAEANRVLGNFSDLNPFERQVMRTIFPFWSWMKFINKAAAQLVLDQPDRVLFYSHLGSLALEPDADGMWEFLQGKTPFMGYLVDVDFLNPYSDALIFQGKNVKQIIKNALEEAESVSPAIALPLYGIGEAAYHVSGSQPFLFPTFTRPSYLEGRPGETTRTLGDTLGGLGYRAFRQFAGPLRNLPEFLPNRIPVIAPEGVIRGTDIAVGQAGVPRYPQGSLRTTGRYARPLLSPGAGRLSGILRTFGLPAPIAEIDRAQRVARENVRAGREARLRRLGERRTALRRLG